MKFKEKYGLNIYNTSCAIHFYFIFIKFAIYNCYILAFLNIKSSLKLSYILVYSNFLKIDILRFVYIHCTSKLSFIIQILIAIKLYIFTHLNV